MTREFFSIQPDETAAQAIRLFLDMDISGLPVVNSHQELVGFVTESDVLESRSNERNIGEIMTKDVLFVRESALLAQVVELIRESRVKHVPVLHDAKQTLVGVISRKDVLRHLYS